ncbi:LysR family transcriptional regulator [Cupriavidus malaysiensis]|uniref:LysR family transcriptional regulator n=2 Tax=Burkholderiaceae TaxID=119060 RepID=A0ABM6FDW9_9BURK|nr:LysR family transcriptional regulator [Cupriavidus malaysiensis]
MLSIRLSNDEMTRNLDIALLRAFVAVADHGSMTAAGRMLHLTQGAISQQIGRLEAQAGPLFARDHRALRLTTEGERWLGPSRHLLAVHDALRDEMKGGTIEGSVRLGAPQDLVAARLGPILKGFSLDHPRVELTLVCATSTELLRTLKRGEVDIALVEELPGAARGECLAVERLVWVGARGGTAFRRSRLPVSLVDEACVFRPAVLDALRKCGRPWRTVFESGSIDATAATVRADLAVTASLASTVPSEFDILAPECGLPELPAFAIHLHVAGGPASAAALALGRSIREDFARGPDVVRVLQDGTAKARRGRLVPQA